MNDWGLSLTKVAGWNVWTGRTFGDDGWWRVRNWDWNIGWILNGGKVGGTGETGPSLCVIGAEVGRPGNLKGVKVGGTGDTGPSLCWIRAGVGCSGCIG